MYEFNNAEEFIQHYGVKGMKWGVRKALQDKERNYTDNLGRNAMTLARARAQSQRSSNADAVSKLRRSLIGDNAAEHKDTIARYEKLQAVKDAKYGKTRTKLRKATGMKSKDYQGKLQARRKAEAKVRAQLLKKVNTETDAQKARRYANLLLETAMVNRNYNSVGLGGVSASDVAETNFRRAVKAELRKNNKK